MHSHVPPNWLPGFQNPVTLKLHEWVCRVYPRLDNMLNLCHIIPCGNSDCGKWQLPQGVWLGQRIPKAEAFYTEVSNIGGIPRTGLPSGLPKLKLLEFMACPK